MLAPAHWRRSRCCVIVNVNVNNLLAIPIVCMQWIDCIATTLFLPTSTWAAIQSRTMAWSTDSQPMKPTIRGRPPDPHNPGPTHPQNPPQTYRWSFHARTPGRTAAVT